MSYFSFNRLVPGAFNLDLIGSTCTALPYVDGDGDVSVQPPVHAIAFGAALAVTARVECESKL